MWFEKPKAAPMPLPMSTITLGDFPSRADVDAEFQAERDKQSELHAAEIKQLKARLKLASYEPGAAKIKAEIAKAKKAHMVAMAGINQRAEAEATRRINEASVLVYKVLGLVFADFVANVNRRDAVQRLILLWPQLVAAVQHIAGQQVHSRHLATHYAEAMIVANKSDDPLFRSHMVRDWPGSVGESAVADALLSQDPKAVTDALIRMELNLLSVNRGQPPIGNDAELWERKLLLHAEAAA